MPSVSKKQQKFMGIVRSIQKGEAPAGKFSKAAQDAAKKMKKSSVKKYAKTKHDDLPTKKEGVQRDRNNLALHIIDLNNMLGQAKLSKNPKAKKYIKMIKQDIKDAEKKLSKLKETIKTTDTGFRWKQIPNRGTIDFGEYGKYMILNKTKMHVDGKWISGRQKGKKVRWYSRDGQKDARQRKGIPFSKTPHFPYRTVKGLKEDRDYKAE